MYKETAKDMLEFIEKSPSSFHVVENLKELHEKEGYVQLLETEEWKLENGGKYFTTRNGSSFASFILPVVSPKGFHAVATHSDSPTYKIKENPAMTVEEAYLKLNVEKYGGMIQSTWLDRPLSIAGRAVVKEDKKLVTKLVNINQDLLVIPNVATHLETDRKKEADYNTQIDMLPLFSGKGKKEDFEVLLAQSAGVEKEQILSHDLFLYVRDKGRILGREGEFVLSPKLDDLQCVFAAQKAMLSSAPKEYINMCIVFDNEEVGSATKQGANSSFFEDIISRIGEALQFSKQQLCRFIAESFLISADNAHALHPNHPEKSDPTNKPILNGGIVIKYHGSQRYATDAISAAILKELCKEAQVPYQIYTNRSDLVGGSTLGNISTAHISVPTVDIGLPQLAMHSAVETAGTLDTFYAIKMLKGFFAC